MARRAVMARTSFAVVVSEREKQRDRMADQPEEVALSEVLRQSIPEEVWVGLPHVAQSLLMHLRSGILVEVPNRPARQK